MGIAGFSHRLSEEEFARAPKNPDGTRVTCSPIRFEGPGDGTRWVADKCSDGNYYSPSGHVLTEEEVAKRIYLASVMTTGWDDKMSLDDPDALVWLEDYEPAE